jgi:two-component system sensor histidine kinase DesK
VLFVVLVALATALTLSDGGSWGFLFTYCAASAGLISARLGMAGVVGCAVLAGVTSAVGGANGGQVVGWVASSAGIGMLILVMRDLRVRNDELRRARAELARMAVAEERARFARDLHDLLGHSLSVIALKAELAGRLLTDQPDQAASEVAELEEVARGALGEVREAVSGYRQPTLDGELAGARMALSAAGIDADVNREPSVLDPAVEGALAWAIREGATNVIRHSGARHCKLTVTSSAAGAGVEVLDDGSGVPSAERNGHGGHGLEGLAERLSLLGGRLEAGGRPGGGYRLAVTVPVTRR